MASESYNRHVTKVFTATQELFEHHRTSSIHRMSASKSPKALAALFRPIRSMFTAMFTVIYAGNICSVSFPAFFAVADIDMAETVFVA